MSGKEKAKQEKQEAEKKAEGHQAEERKPSPQEDKLKELTNDLQRLQAEFENFKKRNEKENQSFKEYANASLIADFLPILDSFDQAVNALEKAENVSKEQALEGTRKLRQQLTSLLAQNGLQALKSKGEKFDPCLHDCLLQENCEGEADGVVLEEIQKGYLLKGRLLRPTKVKINSTEKEGEKE